MFNVDKINIALFIIFQKLSILLSLLPPSRTQALEGRPHRGRNPQPADRPWRRLRLRAGRLLVGGEKVADGVFRTDRTLQPVRDAGEVEEDGRNLGPGNSASKRSRSLWHEPGGQQSRKTRMAGEETAGMLTEVLYGKRPA